MSEARLVRVSIKDKVALLEMVPGTKYVVMTRELIQELSEEVERQDLNPEVNVIVITGNEKSFGVGADIKEVEDNTLVRTLSNDYFERLWCRVIQKVMKPLIAAVHGLCLGGSFEIAMLCDIIVASEDAQFGLPEVKLGIMPGAGGTQRLPRLVGKSKAMEMILTGDPISAKEAREWHLCSSVFPREKLIEEALSLAARIARHS